MERTEDLRKLELKVSIDCEGCKKKVKKVLQSIDGVFETTIDMSLSKVTVVGKVDVETLIKKLAKTGKPAERWPDTEMVKKEKWDENETKKEKKSEAGGSSVAESTEKSSKPGVNSSGGGGSKKGRKKGKKANEDVYSNNSGEVGEPNSGNGSEIPADSSPTLNPPSPQVTFTINPGIVHHASYVTATEAPPNYYLSQVSSYPPHFGRDPHYYYTPEYYPQVKPPATGTPGFDTDYYDDEDTISCSIL